MPISVKVPVGIFLVARSLLGRRRKQVLILKQPRIKGYARLHVGQGHGRAPPLLVHQGPSSQGEWIFGKRHRQGAESGERRLSDGSAHRDAAVLTSVEG